jgi:hypothetical protein
VQHRLDRLDRGRQALEGGQDGVAQSALDSDLIATTAIGHDRLLSPRRSLDHDAAGPQRLHLKKVKSSGSRVTPGARPSSSSPAGDLIRNG